MISAGDMQAVQNLIVRLGGEIKLLIKSCMEISYYSRGAWPYETLLAMSAGERDIAIDIVNERLKIAAKSPFPVY
jgi:hypothetical protein